MTMSIPATEPGFLIRRSEFKYRLDDEPSLLSAHNHRLPGEEAQRFQPAIFDGELRQRVRLALVGPLAYPVIMCLRLADGGCGGMLL